MPGCKFNDQWSLTWPWLKRCKFPHKAFCVLCKKEFSIESMGRTAVVLHSKGKMHMELENPPIVNKVDDLCTPQNDMASTKGKKSISLKSTDSRKLTDVKLQEGQKYRLGDMFWAKVGGHPYWPCMIYYGPGLDIYYKRKSKVSLYHVQFFGPLVERAWVTEASLIEFEGKCAFDLYVEEQIDASKDKKMVRAKFEVKSNRKAVWDASWREAEIAYPLTRDERVFRFGRIYIKTPKQQANTDTNAAQADQPPAKKSRKSITVVNPKRSYKDDNDKKGFMKYFEEKKSSLLSENPSLTDEELEDQAWKLWNEEDDVEKSNYCENTESRSGRRIKLSLKHVELKRQNITSKLTGNEARKRKSSDESSNSVPSSKANSPKRHIENDTLFCGDLGICPPSPATSDRASITAIDDNVDLGEDDNETPLYEFLRLHRSTPSGRSVEPVCYVCEDSFETELLRCKDCGNYYHMKCIGKDSSTSPGSFKCNSCLEGRTTCFSCNRDILNDMIKCINGSCGKAYHEKCAKELPFTRTTDRGFLCSSHLCHACAIDDPTSPKARQGRLVRCLRCPKAYHAGELCLAAGSSELSATYIVCPQHFEIDTKVNKRVNVSWCFTCAQSGELLSCKYCPAAYHAKCLSLNKNIDGSVDFVCHHCAVGKQPRYGQIVWVKVGYFRWWPCEVLHPRDAPLNIQKLPHNKGMFPIHFFGSDEYYWLSKSRVFPYEYTIGSDRQHLSIKIDSGNNKKLRQWFKTGKSVALEAYNAWKAFLSDHLTAARGERRRDNDESDTSVKIIEAHKDSRPAPYKFTKTNVPYGSTKIYTVDISELPRCECQPTQPTPCGSDCLNRMLMYECHPAVCPSGEHCENQRFTKKQYPQQAVFKTTDRGWGLKTLVDIKKGDFVNEYVGDLIEEDEARRRLVDYHVKGVTNFYMLTLDKGRVIDAGPRGNFSRFMNHSCNPNLETQKWMVHGDLRVGLFAVRDISAGEELTFNYNFQSLSGVGEDIPCCCRSSNCSGFLGIRPRSQAMTPNSTASGDNLVKIVPKSDVGLVECYRCGDGGELIACEKENCKKSYHLFCLGLTKPPWGKWHCPWHHCDVCGMTSKSLCSKCPNSFCSAHIDGHFDGNDNICRDHGRV